MRLFIAVNIPDDLKEKIFTFQEELRRAQADVKWVKKDKLHLTLKFLGEVSQENLEQVIFGFAESTSGFTSFNISFTGTGVFPDLHRPRIIWLGIQEDEQKLKKLAEQIEDKMSLLDFPKEKRGFNAHLTLGRLRSQRNKDLLIKRIVKNENINIGSFVIKSIDLMQSILHPEGPEYKCLKSVSI